VLGLPASAAAQPELELYGNVGWSLVDTDDWANQATLNPGRLHFGGNAQFLFARSALRSLQIGAEVGFQRLLAYDVPLASGAVRVSVEEFHAMGVVRFRTRSFRWFGEFAVGAMFFDGFTTPGLGMGVGHYLALGEDLRIPVKARANFVFDIESMMVPLSFYVGYPIGLGGG